MKNERQLYCHDCDTQGLNRFCTKQKGKDGRIDWLGTSGTPNSEPIEFCEIRLQKVEEQQKKGQ